MKSKKFTIITLLLALFILPNFLFSQEIIDVPEEYEGSPFGVINRFIMADTVAGGERAHPDAIYRLKRGGYYDVDHGLSIDFNLTIVGETEPADTRPAMISRGLDAQGGYVSGLFNLRGDSTNLTFKNIILNGVQDNNQIVNRGGSIFGVSGKFHRFVMDNCIFSGWGGNVMNSRDSDRSTYIYTNNVFRNNVDLDNPWGGNLYSSTSKTAYQDTLIFINNTFFNNGSYQILCWEFVDYIEYSHNTMFQASLNAHWAPYFTNAKFNDNIFYNYQTVGQTEYERDHGFFDNGTAENRLSSICKLDVIDPQLLLDHGITEADRKIEYSNNVYFWSDDVTNYWTAHKDSAHGVELDILPITFMNEFTQGMFDDDSGYPNLDSEDNLNINPGFDATMEAAVWAKERAFVVNYRRYGDGGLVDPKERHYAPDGQFWDIAWPLPETMVYTNAEALSAAQGGFPVGDLNWYPEEKIKWEAWTGIEREELDGVLPSEYTLSQNYPNPFNPTTEMNFSIPVSGNTTLAIYNVLGQKVATIVNQELSAGSYKYQFDASNLTSGLYFYQLQSNDYSQVRKMMLLK